MTNTDKAFCLGGLALWLVDMLIVLLDPWQLELLAAIVVLWPVRVCLDRLQDKESG